SFFITGSSICRNSSLISFSDCLRSMSPLSQAKTISWGKFILCKACSIEPIPLNKVASLIITYRLLLYRSFLHFILKKYNLPDPDMILYHSKAFLLYCDYQDLLSLVPT